MIGVLEPELATTTAPSTAPLAWMQVLSHLDPKYGGISTAVPSLAQALSAFSVASSIEAFCANGEEYRPAGIRADTTHYWPVSRLRWFREAALRAGFGAETRHHDGVHIHGLWDVTSAEASRAALRSKKPYLLSSHGMLEPWALTQGKLKKRIYSACIEREVVRNANCLHALTEAEALQYRSYTGRRVPTVVIPNGVSIPETVSAELFLSTYPELRGRRIVLFLSRLHVKKGIDLLVRAWQSLAASVQDAVLVVAGPDADGMRNALRELTVSHGTQHSVLFPGMLAGEMKWSALAAAECMVLPSHSEGLSMSILEALGAGVPVLVTPHCNVPWVSQIGAGWLTDPTIPSLQRSLADILSRTPKSNGEAGVIARDYIREHYSWASVAERMAEVYRWCVGGDAPVLSEVIQ